MKNGRVVIFFLCAIFVLGIFIREIDFSSLATDSGFDTSYDSGGSSGGSSSGGFSGGRGSSSSGSSNVKAGLGALLIIYFFEFFVFNMFYYGMLQKKYESRNVSHKKKKSVSYVVIRTILLIFLNFILFYVVENKNFSSYCDSVFFVLFIDLIILGIVAAIFNKSYGSLIDLSVSEEEGEGQIQNILTMEELVKPEVICDDMENIKKKAYQIFYDVQISWMNFDYDTMRLLVTDELYNMYYNQLKTLELKSQKNIMSDFQLKNVKLINVSDEKEVQTYKLILKVSFYDYIVNQTGMVIRGNKDVLVEMTYLLEFVSNKKILEVCPHCGAKLESNSTICTYCNTHIQGASNDMKLAKKEVILQNNAKRR